MSNSNDDGDKSLPVVIEALPTEQNNEQHFRNIIDEKIESGAIYGDQNFLNKVKELRDLVLVPLLQFNQWDLLGAIMYVLSDDLLPLRRKTYIVDNLIDIVKNKRGDLSFKFCVEHVFPFTGDLGIIKAREESQIRMNEESFYSYLRISEAQTMSQIRIDEDYQKKMNTINTQLLLREGKHEQDVRFARDTGTGNSEDLRRQTTTDSEIAMVDYFDLEKSFIEEKWLVKIMQDSEPKIYYWDNEH